MIDRLDSSSSDRLPPGVLASGIGTAPPLAWSVDIATTASTFGQIVASTSPTIHESVIDAGDVLVFRVVHENDTAIVGIDSTSGEVRWTASTGAGTCAPQVMDGTVACSDGAEKSTVDTLETSTGEVVDRTSFDFAVGALTRTAETLYVSGQSENGDLIGSARAEKDSDTGVDWTVQQTGDCSGVSSSTPSVAAVGDLVSLSTPGRPAMVVRASTGEIVVAETPSAVPLGKELLDVATCGSATVTVMDGTGKAVHRNDSRTNPAGIEASTSAAPWITATGRAYESATFGDEFTLTAQTSAVDAVVGDLVVVSRADGLAAHTLSSGAEMWTHPSESEASVDATDGKVLVVSDGASTLGISALDGTVIWDLQTGSDSAPAESTAVESGLITVSEGRLELRTPTGGPTVLGNTVGAAPDDDTASDGSDAAGSTNAGAGGPDGDDYVTRCGSAPVFTPTKITTEPDGLHVTMSITATCPDGDVLSSSRTRIAVSASGKNVAAAAFDLSSEPVAIPARGSGSTPLAASRTFTFPLGSFWRTARDLPTTGDAGATLPSSSTGSTYLVECEQEGPSSTERLRLPDNTIDLAPLPASDVAAPITGDAESSAFDALRAIADSDRPVVTSAIADRWVPQLSSKKPGLVADGRVWDNAGTLEEHLALRLRFPDARLVWTGEWSTFSFSDFWVTLAGPTFPDADSALGWCTAEGFDGEHCYAKLVSTSRPIEGSTKTQ